jgi:hypothetical protein
MLPFTVLGVLLIAAAFFTYALLPAAEHCDSPQSGIALILIYYYLFIYYIRSMLILQEDYFGFSASRQYSWRHLAFLPPQHQ